jgi:eukaryotic-like serine/threonine-protein kinase
VDDAAPTVETLDTLVTETSGGSPTRSEAELPGVGAIIAGRYRLERVLGQGGMGAVFAGRHVVTGRQVAIKVLRDDPVRNRGAALRMAREARAVGRIQHPNVVAVYDAGLAGARPFIAMELLDGESLEQRIERTGPMSEPEAIRTLQQIARGVEAAHANGIIHRDLKPANILLCPADGAVKVVDFGISKLQGDAEDDVLVTHHGVQLGTPVFMSPEQVRGDSLDARTDVYALAVILYYTLTRRYPFHDRSRAALFAKILTAQPEPLTGVSPGVARVVARGLARDRAARFESVAALAAALSPRARSTSRLVASRVVYALAAVGGIALAVMPTRSMHAAPSEPEHPVTVEPVVTEPPVAESPPAAAEAPAAPEPAPEVKVAPARPKARAAPPSRKRAAPSVPDATTTDDVKLMSW